MHLFFHSLGPSNRASLEWLVRHIPHTTYRQLAVPRPGSYFNVVVLLCTNLLALPLVYEWALIGIVCCKDEGGDYTKEFAT